MKVKTSTLKGAALDWAVCMALGLKPEDIYLQKWGSLPASLFRRNRDEDGKLDGSYTTGPDLLFSHKWEAGGPLLDLYEITLDYRDNETLARKWNGHDFVDAYAGKRQGLLAGMRCLVDSKLGDTVEIPNELA